MELDWVIMTLGAFGLPVFNRYSIIIFMIDNHFYDESPGELPPYMTTNSDRK